MRNPILRPVLLLPLLTLLTVTATGCVAVPVHSRAAVVHTSVHGTHLVRLPAGSRPVIVGARTYHFHGGTFYEHRGGRYVAVTAPLGARIESLPKGHATVRVRGVRYYRHGRTYYRWDRGAYRVVRKP